MAEAFPIVLRDPIEDENTLLIGGERGFGRAPAEDGGGACAGAANDRRAEAARLEPALAGGEVYTDDRAPVEWLIDRSILGYAAGD